MKKIRQLYADLRYYLCKEPMDMKKQFQGQHGIVDVSEEQGKRELVRNAKMKKLNTGKSMPSNG